MMFRDQSQGSHLLSFLVTAFGLLIVCVPFYFIVLRQGWAGVIAMPYAIPIAAVALAIIVAIGHRIGGTSALSYRMPVRRGNAGGGIVAGLILVAAGIFMSFKAGADTHRYQNDPSCSAGFAGAGVPGGCRLEHMKITATYACGRHDNSSCLTLESADGSLSNVSLARNIRGNVYRGARDDGDRLAEVQYFDGRIVEVETRSGLLATTNLPLESEKFWTLMGLVGGFFGLVAAAVVMVRGIF